MQIIFYVCKISPKKKTTIALPAENDKNPK